MFKEKKPFISPCHGEINVGDLYLVQYARLKRKYFNIVIKSCETMVFVYDILNNNTYLDFYDEKFDGRHQITWLIKKVDK